MRILVDRSVVSFHVMSSTGVLIYVLRTKSLLVNRKLTIVLHCADGCIVQVEAFAMDGRGAMTRRVYPFFWNTSIGASLVYHVPHKTPRVESPLVTVRVWQMGSGYT